MTTSTILSDNGATSGTSGLKTSGGNDGTLILQTTTAGGTATTALTIDTSQNVGIGTTSPATPLHVKGANNEILRLQSSDATTGSLYLSYVDSAGTEKGYVGYGSSTNNDFIISNALSGDTRFNTNGIERMRILSTGNILSLSGGSTTATGTGITFPATQSASTDANTLDDYEEGSWTPTITPVSGTITTSTLTGTYTKVGRLVSLFLKIVITNKGTATGTYFTVGGRPFTPAFDTCGVSLTLDTGVGKASDFQTGVWYMYIDSINNYTYTSQVNYYVS